LLPENNLFDNDAPLIFNKLSDNNLEYCLAVLNSKLAAYIINCLNPTVKTQVGDVKRIPFIKAPLSEETKISKLAAECILIKKSLSSFSLIEPNFYKSPIIVYSNSSITERLMTFLNYENEQLTKILLNEALINTLVIDLYELCDNDVEKIEASVGKIVGNYPINELAKKSFLSNLNDIDNKLLYDHIQSLAIDNFDEALIREIKENLNSLYKGNSNLEEFCIKYKVNPINVWYWFKESNNVPASRAAEIALEFLADTIRTLLQQDEDGIIPLVGLPGEDALSLRLEQYCLQNGFTAAQYIQLDILLSRSINEYLQHHFFNNLSLHLKLFKQLPATPFIWHLSSGQHQGFAAYILIYKWNRDSLFKLKSRYINERVQNLEYRQITLQDVNTAQAQTEKETIRLQLREIETFKTKIDELIAENYDPKLDDGVGKNIAPLQKKGLLRADVLKTTGGKKSQLEKYLNADW
jgi:hypothetical protein